ncbi:hypothetical protein B0H14DRAFT_3480883 [Mycena olivaceomarginata]|nr:hypothetical protein B0H14DRAFT_3480883 [Mycena olivaceomarginata]
MDPRDDNLDRRDDRPLAAVGAQGLSLLLYITGAPPVPEILSALNSCNPDFLFGYYIDLDDYEDFDFASLLVWLKDIQAPPVGFIER